MPVAVKCIALFGVPIVIVGIEEYPEPPLITVRFKTELLPIDDTSTASSPVGDALTVTGGATV